MSNPFDQFDAPANGAAPAAPENPFDRFDTGAAPKAKSDTPILDMVNSAIRGAADTATFGMADRMRAGLAAATGIGGRFGEYERNLLQERAKNKYYSEAAPISGVAGQLAGGLALPVGATGGAATLGGRIAAGAGAGALQGGLYGAGSSEDLTNLPDVGKNAATGAAIGGLIGGAAPPLVEGAINAGRAVGNRLGITPAIRGALNPEQEAARRVAGALERDATIGGQGLDPAAMRAAQQSGQPAVVADLGGEATRGLARSSANTSPEARQALQVATSDRFESQAPRIGQFVSDLGGGSDATTTIERLNDAARRANRPAYQRAYTEGANGVWNENLGSLMEAPAVQDAVRSATRTGANRSVADGFKPVRSPFEVAADGTITPRVDANGAQAIPSLQFWDHVKRNLDDTIGKLQRSGERSAAADAQALRSRLVEQLDEASPSYAAARGTAAQFFGAEDAVEAGARFVGARGENAEFRRVIGNMSAPERQLFAHGFASELADKVSETGDRRSVLNSVFQSPAARERVTMAMGPARAARLEAFLNVEATMDLLRTAVQGNSTTARQLAELGAAGGIGGGIGYLQGGGSPGSITAGVLLGSLARHGALRINANVAQRVGEMLASRDPATYQRALNTIAQNREFMRALRNLAPKTVAAILPTILNEQKKKSSSKDAARGAPNGRLPAP